MANETNPPWFVLDPSFVRPTYDHNSFLAFPQSMAGLLGRAPRTAFGQALSSTLGAQFDKVLLTEIHS